MFKIQLISMPAIDLKQFMTLTTPEGVNGVDTHYKTAADKFCALADDLLFKGFGERHLYYVFYLELPIQTTVVFDSFWNAHAFRKSTIADGMMVKGIISGPLDIWRSFILWTQNDDYGRELAALGKAIEKSLPPTALKSLR